MMRRAKYKHLTLPEVFLDKLIPDTEAVGQCDILVVKMLM